jgi:hypothetical protein
MSYTPDPFDDAEPTTDKSVESAAAEFRTIKEPLVRTLRFPAADIPAYRGELPAAALRAGRFLAFDATTGQPITGPLINSWTITQSQISNIDSVAADIAEIVAVAGNSANINTVAANNSNVTAVGTNIANVNAVASNQADISTVANNIALLTGLAGQVTQLQSFRNVLINGTFSVQQYAPGALDTSAQYVADGWILQLATFGSLSSASATVVVMPTASGFVGARALQITATSTASLQMYHTQRIEGIRAEHLATKPVRVRFRIHNYRAHSFFGVITLQTCDVLNNFASLSFTNTVSANFSAAPGLSTIDVQLVCPAGSERGLNLLIDTGSTPSSTSGLQIAIGDIQLYSGTANAPVEIVPPDIELARCRRYKQSGRTGIGGYQQGGGKLQQELTFPVPMWASPSVQAVSVQLANASSPVLVDVSSTGFRWESTCSSTTLNMYAGFTWAATAEL